MKTCAAENTVVMVAEAIAAAAVVHLDSDRSSAAGFRRAAAAPGRTRGAEADRKVVAGAWNIASANKVRPEKSFIII